MTSEERLLSIIRKKKHPAKDEQADVKKDKESGRKESESSKIRNGFNFDVLKWSNRILLAASFLIFIYIFHQYIEGRGKENVLLTSLERMKNEEKKSEKVHVPKISFPAGKPFSFYQEKIQQRDIFQAPWDKPKENAPADASLTSDLNKQLKLVGILLDEDSKAIMENVQTKETVFLSVGDNIVGATLEEIREDKVIFRVNDEKVEFVQ